MPAMDQPEYSRDSDNDFLTELKASQNANEELGPEVQEKLSSIVNNSSADPSIDL